MSATNHHTFFNVVGMIKYRVACFFIVRSTVSILIFCPYRVNSICFSLITDLKLVNDTCRIFLCSRSNVFIRFCLAPANPNSTFFFKVQGIINFLFIKQSTFFTSNVPMCTLFRRIRICIGMISYLICIFFIVRSTISIHILSPYCVQNRIVAD